MSRTTASRCCFCNACSVLPCVRWRSLYVSTVSSTSLTTSALLSSTAIARTLEACANTLGVCATTWSACWYAFTVAASNTSGFARNHADTSVARYDGGGLDTPASNRVHRSSKVCCALGSSCRTYDSNPAKCFRIASSRARSSASNARTALSYAGLRLSIHWRCWFLATRSSTRCTRAGIALRSCAKVLGSVLGGLAFVSRVFKAARSRADSLYSCTYTSASICAKVGSASIGGSLGVLPLLSSSSSSWSSAYGACFLACAPCVRSSYAVRICSLRRWSSTSTRVVSTILRNCLTFSSKLLTLCTKRARASNGCLSSWCTGNASICATRCVRLSIFCKSALGVPWRSLVVAYHACRSCLSFT